jgi:hypothetical protein
LKIIFCGDYFTDRDQGEGFVLSENRATSGAGESKYIEANGIDAAGDRCMKSELFGMCQNVCHIDELKQVVNWVQMYNNNWFSVRNILL